MDFNQWDQRIGKRQQVRSVPIAWTKDPERPSGFAAESHPDGRIVEVSVSGAGIVATADDTIEVGDKMHLQCLGAIGPVLVRRIERNMYPGQHYYGIEYAEPMDRIEPSERRERIDLWERRERRDRETVCPRGVSAMKRKRASSAAATSSGPASSIFRAWP